MSGLFDLIKGVALIAGGAKESRMDEEDRASQNKYREEDIAVKREGISSTSELAQAQRALTEKLTERQIGSQEKMQGERIDWEGKRLKAEQEFSRSENLLIKAHATSLAKLQIEAQKALQEKSISSQEGMQEKRLRQDMIIARMNEALAKMGYKLQEDKIRSDHSLGLMGVIVNAVGLAQKPTQGAEGFYTMISQKNPELAGILNAQEQKNLETIFKAIDPKGEMGLRGLDINKYVVPVSKGASGAADQLAQSMGVPLPQGGTPIPSTRLNDNVAPPVGGGGGGAFLPSPVGELHPGDQLGLDKVSSQIMGLPDSERAIAFGEYNQLINDSANSFVGGNDPEYRKKMVRYLGKSTGFDITK